MQLLQQVTVNAVEPREYPWRATPSAVAGLDAHDEHASLVEGRFLMVQVPKAARKQPGTDEEHQRQGDLCHDQDLARAAATWHASHAREIAPHGAIGVGS